MPTKSTFMTPELFVEHKGIKVYCTYKNDDIENNGASDYHFTLDPVNGGYEEGSFDVRDLPTWKEPAHPPYLNGEANTPENHTAWEKYFADRVLDKAVKQALVDAIDQGIVLKPDDVEYPADRGEIIAKAKKLIKDNPLKINIKSDAAVADTATGVFVEAWIRVEECK